MTTHATDDEFLELQWTLAGVSSLSREVGRGGMGIVFLARDVQRDRDVAKVRRLAATRREVEGAMGRPLPGSTPGSV